jgi:hypothetical protein
MLLLCEALSVSVLTMLPLLAAQQAVNTQFTCFTSTKVPILTAEEERSWQQSKRCICLRPPFLTSSPMLTYADVC